MVNHIAIFNRCIMSNQKYHKSNIGIKHSENGKVIAGSRQDENYILKDNLVESIEISSLLNAGPSEKLKSLLGKTHTEKSSMKKLNELLNDNLSDQYSNFFETTPSSSISLDLPVELQNIGPSERLKRLRRPIPPRRDSSEVSLPDDLHNVNVTIREETLQRLHGPTPGSKCISEPSLPHELLNLGPSEKLLKLRGLSPNDCYSGNNLPNELKNVGPSEKLRKLRGPTSPNSSLKRCLPVDHRNVSQSKQCKRPFVTDRKPNENVEKPHQIFQKRLQAIIKKPLGNTLKKIEPASLKTKHVTKTPFTKVHDTRSKGIGNTINDNKKEPVPILKDQLLPVKSDQTCILDLKGRPKLIVKGSGKQLAGQNKTSKFFKVPLDIYEELKKAFSDSQCLDKRKTEQILRSIEHCQTLNKQSPEVDELTLVQDEVPAGGPDYSEKETLLSTTLISQNSDKDNDCGPKRKSSSVTSGIVLNDDVPKVKLNSKQNITISHTKNNSLRKELDEINEFRRRFPRTYKQKCKRKFLFDFRNKVDSKKLVSAPAVPEFLPNRVPSEPLEPIDLEAGEWNKLYTPSEIRMPLGPSIAPMIHRLRARLPTLTGRDKLEVSFLLSIMSTFPNMTKEIKELMYQRLHLVYLAIMFSWETALTLAQAPEQMSLKPITSPIEKSQPNPKESVAYKTKINTNSCPKNGSLQTKESTRMSQKPQYRFEILIKEKTTCNKFGS